MYDASIEDIYKVITDILNGVLTSHKVFRDISNPISY